ncbi:Apoptosis-inducing factor 1, mitochondrial [Metarhizium acridum]|uniref:Apoptosis-inducing factor 1, mitochondrial n=1 Tax=Metarhizium acridum TaxID=92637 RepID=UPI001C6B41D0|nr:Apoptosis-inducing factor 1, mitochondrial [Metarhizium acridum]
MRTTVLKSKDYRMVVVAPTTHFHWPIAMPRVVVPGQMPVEKIMYPLEPTFREYPEEKFEFVLGSASDLDPEGSVVTVALNDGTSRAVPYDTLFIATGSSAKDEMPWKLVGTADNTFDRIHALQKQVQGAETIVVAGGGLTGAETAGEIGYQYGRKGNKEVYFIYNDDLPLSPGVMESVRKQTKVGLERMKVKLVPKTTVTKATTRGRDTILELRHADGTTRTLTAQAYLPTTGVTPNTSFVPKSMLDENGYVRQTSFLRADGYKNIFVVGDAGSLEDNRSLAADAQAGHLIKFLPAYFEGGSLPEYKVNSKTMYGITLGQSKATGQMGNMKVFSWIVWFLKGRFLGTDKVPGIAAGKMTMSATFEK